MGAGNDVLRNQFAHTLSGLRPGANRSLHRTNIAADHNGDIPATNLLHLENIDISRLAHRVSGLNHARRPLGLNQPQSPDGTI